jgi:hypothetical protein
MTKRNSILWVLDKGHHANPTMATMFMYPKMMLTKINTLIDSNFIYYYVYWPLDDT